MRLFDHYHNHKLHKAIHSDFWQYEFSVWLHTVGRSLISIFVPILMLGFGFSIPTVILYYLIFNAFDVPLNFFARWFTIKFGARMAIIVATFGAILYFVLFSGLSSGAFWLLIVLAFLDALYDSLYWTSHMYLFFESTDKAHDAAQSTGIISSIRSFAGMMGPAVGALVILLKGEYSLMIASILFFAISILPLLHLKHIKDKPAPSKFSLQSFFADRHEKRNYLRMFLSSASSAIEGILWPMFIFSVVGTFDSIALIAVIASIGKVAFSYVTGSLSRQNGNMLVVVGACATIVIWVVRLAFPNPAVYYASILLAGFFAIMMSIPIDSGITERAKIKNSLDTAMMRNAVSMSGYLAVFVVLAFLVNVFQVSFFIAILSLVFLIIVNRVLVVSKAS